MRPDLFVGKSSKWLGPRELAPPKPFIEHQEKMFEDYSIAMYEICTGEKTQWILAMYKYKSKHQNHIGHLMLRRNKV